MCSAGLPGRRFLPLLGIPGLVDVVRCGTSPTEVCADEIDALRRVGDSRLKTEPWPELVGAQSVAVVDGPLSGITGALVEVKNQVRLLISVSILRRSVLVEIDRDWVVPIHSTDPLRNNQSMPAVGCATA